MKFSYTGSQCMVTKIKLIWPALHDLIMFLNPFLAGSNFQQPCLLNIHFTSHHQTSIPLVANKGQFHMQAPNSPSTLDYQAGLPDLTYKWVLHYLGTKQAFGLLCLSHPASNRSIASGLEKSQVYQITAALLHSFCHQIRLTCAGITVHGN